MPIFDEIQKFQFLFWPFTRNPWVRLIPILKKAEIQSCLMDITCDKDVRNC